MCGIAGFVTAERLDPDKIVVLANELLKEIESRGTDATGVAVRYVEDTGRTRVRMFKLPKKATEFIKEPEYKRLLSLAPNAVLLHTRAKTSGDAANNANNHPHRIGPVVGVHNGIISNHEELKRRHGYTGPEVDSMAIWMLLGMENGDSYVERIKRSARKLCGSFACAVLDERFPEHTYLFTGGSSLSVASGVREKVVVWASTTEALYNAFDCAFGRGGSFFPTISVIAAEKIAIDIKGNEVVGSLTITPKPYVTTQCKGSAQTDWSYSSKDNGWTYGAEDGYMYGNTSSPYKTKKDYRKASALIYAIECRRRKSREGMERFEAVVKKLEERGKRVEYTKAGRGGWTTWMLFPMRSPSCGIEEGSSYYAVLKNESLTTIWERNRGLIWSDYAKFKDCLGVVKTTGVLPFNVFLTPQNEHSVSQKLDEPIDRWEAV